MRSSPPSANAVPALQTEVLWAAFQQLPAPLVMTTAQLDRPGPVIVAANAAFSRLTGYGIEELLGQTPRLLQGPLTNRAVLDELRQRAAAGERFVGQATNYRKDGSTYTVEWCIDPIRGAEGTVTHFIAVQREIPGAAPVHSAPPNASCARLVVQTEQAALLAEAALVLERSKRSFRSTELAQLRRRLEQALRRWSKTIQ
jgi:PAS domain S-box-containing protein